MRIKSKKKNIIIILTGAALVIYLTWLFLRPVEIIAVHQENNYSDIIVRNFPLTNDGKINWWLKNKDMLKAKYNIPKPASYGSWTVIFWNFDDGYKKDENYTDRLCFKDMKPPVNCIEKDAVFSVDKSRNLGISLTTYDGNNYRLGQNGEIQKVESD